MFSQSGRKLRSCKDQSVPDAANGNMTQLNNDCHKSVNEVASLSVTDGLYDVMVLSLIECIPCGITFQDMNTLEKHLVDFHKETTRRFNPLTLERHAVTDDDEPRLDEAQVHQNGDGPSSPHEITEPQEPTPVINARFKTKCTWCNKEFLCEPIDAETMADASGFMCPNCKNKVCGALDKGLSRSLQH